jgi:C4-dicarboxylate-specific signal transduction histidine kinase
MTKLRINPMLAGGLTEAQTKVQMLLRYLAAMALVALALCLSLALQFSFDNPFWFLFAIAVISSTWICGKGPGWLAVGLSSIAAFYFFIPPYRAWNLNLRDLPFFLAFVSCQITTNRVVSWRKDSEQALRQARDELEARVQERTAELKTAHQALLDRIAEQKRIEEVLQAVRADLARVARITTVGELTASIAHEVNQPLAAVVANADACVAWLGLENPDLGEARTAANRAAEGATRASGVIARIRSLINKTPPQQAWVQLNQVIEETMAVVSRQASQSQVAVSIELRSGLPEVLGDRIQLQQVILNLIINGIEAMATVTSRPRQLLIRSQFDGNERQVRVSVEDTGVGVSAEKMARLFEPFFTTRSEGIGMGLPISRSIIEAHGGRLWVESIPDNGSNFQFTLPSAEGRAA